MLIRQLAPRRAPGGPGVCHRTRRPTRRPRFVPIAPLNFSGCHALSLGACVACASRKPCTLPLVPRVLLLLVWTVADAASADAAHLRPVGLSSCTERVCSALQALQSAAPRACPDKAQAEASGRPHRTVVPMVRPPSTEESPSVVAVGRSARKSACQTFKFAEAQAINLSCPVHARIVLRAERCPCGGGRLA